MSIAARVYTYEDLLETPEGDGKRYEIIGGELVVSASPAKRHVFITNHLYGLLYISLRGSQTFKPIAGPVDVQLSLRNVVVPDIIILALDRLNIFGDQSVVGSPDVIVEVLSPSTRQRDLGDKFDLFARTGVTEYWVVDPTSNTITINVLGPTGSYTPNVDKAGGPVSQLLPDFVFDLEAIFRER